MGGCGGELGEDWLSVCTREYQMTIRDEQLRCEVLETISQECTLLLCGTMGVIAHVRYMKQLQSWGACRESLRYRACLSSSDGGRLVRVGWVAGLGHHHVGVRKVCAVRSGKGLCICVPLWERRERQGGAYVRLSSSE